jgi:Family of unknown function (DUF5320)
MPGFDRTGPLGQGPRTGGGFGYCGSSAGAGRFGGFRFAGSYGCDRRSRRAFGSEFGYGRRPGIWGEGYYPGVSPRVRRKEERDYLMDQIAQLKAGLEAMENRLAALGPDQEGKTET